MINFKKKKLSGWGRTNFSECLYFKTSNLDQINEIFKDSVKTNKKITFRGAARSYGDNTLNKKNIVLNYCSEKSIYSFDEITGKILVSGSSTLVEVLKFSIPKGWLFHVSPASQFITVAGAISNNVHGKNCFQKGYFGDYIEEIEILTPEKGLILCSPSVNSDLFFAVISGMGAFGIIVKAKIQLRKINTAIINTNLYQVKNLEEAVEKIENLSTSSEFNIGSLNFSRYNKGVNFGKIYSSSFLNVKKNVDNDSEPNVIIYLLNYILLLNNLPGINRLIEYSMSLAATDIRIKKEIVQTYYSMNFLGEKYLPLYNYFFKNGLIEYQVILDKFYFLKTIEEIKTLMKNYNYSSYMSSLKTYSPANEKYMFGLTKNGYGLTLDIPFEKNKKFEIFVRKLNEITLKNSGQVYVGKTPCLTNEEFKEMYPNYSNFKKIKIKYDPNLLLISEMTSRLFSDVYNYKY